MEPVKCAHCGLPLAPRPNNREKQKYCGSHDCQKRRNRTKNKTYRKEKGKDLAFKLAESKRQQEIRDRRRYLAKLDSPAPPPPPPAPVPEGKPLSGIDLTHYNDTLLGLAAMFTGSDDPEDVRGIIIRFAETGRRLRGECRIGRAIEKKNVTGCLRGNPEYVTG